MGRVPRRGRAPTRALAAALLVCSLFASTACRAVGTGPVEVTLAELAAEQEAYDGRHVTTQGMVRTYPEPLHYWVEDADLNRVELVPHDVAAPLLDEEVRVTGRFTFRDDRGRVIEVDEIERAPLLGR